MLFLATLVLALASLSILGHYLGGAYYRRVIQHSGGTKPKDWPQVCALKPLKGLEDGLGDNLRTLLEQDYPGELSIVFVANDPHDPGFLMAQKAVATTKTQENRRVYFCTSNPNAGMNPKVANLMGADSIVEDRLRETELLFQSDANTRLELDYLRRQVMRMKAEGADCVSSVVRGAGAQTFGASLENHHLGSFVIPGMSLADRAGTTCLCGKSIIIRHKLFREIGGWKRLANYLCEDFVLGELLAEKGHKVLLAGEVQNYNEACTSMRFWERHTRWLKMRATLSRLAFSVDLLSNVTLAALVLLLLSPPAWPVSLALILLKTAVDVENCNFSGAYPLRYAEALFMGTVRDVLLIPMWLLAAVDRTVWWRGKRLRFGPRTEITRIPDSTMAPSAAQNRTA